MKHRNAIEGTQSELVRGHGLRRARYRGLSKVKLQNYFIGAACNVKRWLRREAWKLKQAAATLSAQAGTLTSDRPFRRRAGAPAKHRPPVSSATQIDRGTPAGRARRKSCPLSSPALIATAVFQTSGGPKRIAEKPHSFHRNQYIELTPGASDKLIKPGGIIRETQPAMDLEGLIGKYIQGNLAKPDDKGPPPR